MKISTRNFRPASSRIGMALVLASLLGALTTGPALGRDYDRREWRDDRGWHERERYREYRRAYRHPYYYSAPVYAPPPAYYYPEPTPGISFFFPIEIR